MSEHAPSDPAPSRLNPARMSLADAARVLTRAASKPITEAMLEADVAAGAPTNEDGTLNLVRYAAWITREVGRRAH